MTATEPTNHLGAFVAVAGLSGALLSICLFFVNVVAATATAGAFVFTAALNGVCFALARRLDRGPQPSN